MWFTWVLACGSITDGCVRFYDSGLRLMAWFDDLHAGAITSIAFAAPTVRMGFEYDPSHDPEALDAPDFVVGTTTARMVAVKAASFDRPELPRCETLNSNPNPNPNPLETVALGRGSRSTLYRWSLPP